MKGKEIIQQAIRHHSSPRAPLGELVIEDDFVRDYTGEKKINEALRAEVICRLGLDAVCLDNERDITFMSRETDLFLFALVGGGFSGLMKKYPFQEAMALIIQKPDRVSKIISREIKNNEEKARSLLQAGAHGVMIADDIAYDRGPYASPRFFRERVFPSLADTISRLKANGTPVFFHSDGNLTLFLEDLVKMGFHGLQCLEQKAGMDLVRIKKTHGAKLCLMGGIDIDILTGKQNKAHIRQEAARVARIAAPGGGFIFGTNSGLFAGVGIESLKILYEEASGISAC